ncbi:MAG: LysR family transcriptional regulator [Desulfobacterales bacterium]|jgi:molybdate transport system regulatory protein|nr:LysR family transcriptional regulator [Desulfobacterales bacterium]
MIKGLKDRPVVRLHLWLETEKGVFFGLGRWKLLEKIQSGQSLKGAAESLGMSYRAAWGKIKNTEKVLGVALIEKKAGKRAGYRLTAEGVAMLTCFARWFAEVERYALQRAGKLLSCHPIAFSEKDWQHSIDSANDLEHEASLP